MERKGGVVSKRRKRREIAKGVEMRGCEGWRKGREGGRRDIARC